MRIGILSDLHCELAPEHSRSWINRYEPLELGRRVRDAIDIFSAERPDFVLLLGDTTELGDRGASDFIFSLMGNVVGPIIAVPGNHDGGGDTTVLANSAHAHGVRLLEGRSMRAAGVTVLGVGIAPAAAASPDFRGSMETPPRDGSLTIVASHFPLISHESEITAAGLPYSGDLVNREELEPLLQQARTPTVVFSGHVHARCSATAGYVLQLTVAAMIESPFECTVVDIDFTDDDAISARRRAFSLGDAAAANPVFAPEDERWEWRDNRWRR